MRSLAVPGSFRYASVSSDPVFPYRSSALPNSSRLEPKVWYRLPLPTPVASARSAGEVPA